MPRVVVTENEAATRRLGRDLAGGLRGGSVVALSGDLGTGKTALVRGMCEHLGCARQVTSPTFTIINEYDGEFPVFHCDLYRLQSIDEMLSIGLEDVFVPDHVVLIEWAERAREILPVPRIEIICTHMENEFERRYIINEATADGESMLTPVLEGTIPGIVPGAGEDGPPR